jgi:carbonic anhydrase
MIEGNERFVATQMERSGQVCCQRRRALASGQEPFAMVLGCSDSRVPAEIVFDQGLGDLFVIRVAGNVVYPSQIGSVEFAAENFGTQLLMVLGHSACGAVQAAIQDIRQPNSGLSPNLRSILDHMHPAIAPLVRSGDFKSERELEEACIRANVRESVTQLMRGSECIERLIERGLLKIVGATYCLESGSVTLID